MLNIPTHMMYPNLRLFMNQISLFIIPRNPNLPVRIGEDLTSGPGSNPSLDCSSPLNSRTHASATGSTIGDSATDPSIENRPTSIEEGIRSGEADTPTITDPDSENPPTERGIRSTEADAPSVSIARGDSAVNPINNSETYSPGISEAGDTCEILLRTTHPFMITKL